MVCEKNYNKGLRSYHLLFIRSLKSPRKVFKLNSLGKTLQSSSKLGSRRGPDATAEDGAAVDGTAVDCTAEDGTAEVSKMGGRYGKIT